MMSKPVGRLLSQLLLLLLLLLARPTPAAATASPPCFFFMHLQKFADPRVPRSRGRHLPPPLRAALESPGAVFERWFQGQFDNADQVAGERAQGMVPGEGGGHEQIHCVLEPLPALPPGALGGGERFLGR